MSRPPSSAEDQIPHPPWIARGSRTRLRLLAIGIFLGIFAVNLVLDFTVSRAAGSSTVGYLISDAVAALIATVLLLRIIGLQQERRQAMRRRLFVISEMNHHVRNALDAIQMSAQLTRDRDAINIIADEVGRIQWALREVLGAEQEEQG